MSDKVLDALQIASELTGTEWSKAAVKTILYKLGPYPEAQSIAAIDKAMSECRGRLTLNDILQNLPDPLGYRGPEEAWAICLKALRDESVTVFRTEEEASSSGAAWDLLQAGDKVAARMAFIETYSAALTRAKVEKRRAEYKMSPGSDRDGREQAIMEAVQKKLITVKRATTLLPHLSEEEIIKCLPIGNQSAEVVALIEQVSESLQVNKEAVAL